MKFGEFEHNNGDDNIVDDSFETSGSFTIPKRAKCNREDDYNLEDVTDDPIKRQELVNVINSYFWLPDSRQQFRFTKCFLVHNDDLEHEFDRRRREMRRNLDKDASLGYAFLNAYADEEGKAKSVSLDSCNLEPTPNFDCHLSKVLSSELLSRSTSSRVLFDAFQMYVYEYKDAELVTRPRSICPHAIVHYTYGSTEPLKELWISVDRNSVLWSGVLRCGDWSLPVCNMETIVPNAKPFLLANCLTIDQLVSFECCRQWTPVKELINTQLQQLGVLCRTRELELTSGFAVYARLVAGNECEAKLRQFCILMRRARAALLARQMDVTTCIVSASRIGQYIVDKERVGGKFSVVGMTAANSCRFKKYGISGGGLKDIFDVDTSQYGNRPGCNYMLKLPTFQQQFQRASSMLSPNPLLTSSPSPDTGIEQVVPGTVGVLMTGAPDTSVPPPQLLPPALPQNLPPQLVARDPRLSRYAQTPAASLQLQQQTQELGSLCTNVGLPPVTASMLGLSVEELLSRQMKVRGDVTKVLGLPSSSLKIGNIQKVSTVLHGEVPAAATDSNWPMIFVNPSSEQRAQVTTTSSKEASWNTSPADLVIAEGSLADDNLSNGNRLSPSLLSASATDDGTTLGNLSPPELLSIEPMMHVLPSPSNHVRDHFLPTLTMDTAVKFEAADKGLLTDASESTYGTSPVKENVSDGAERAKSKSPVQSGFAKSLHEREDPFASSKLLLDVTVHPTANSSQTAKIAVISTDVTYQAQEPFVVSQLKQLSHQYAGQVGLGLPIAMNEEVVLNTVASSIRRRPPTRAPWNEAEADHILFSFYDALKKIVDVRQRGLSCPPSLWQAALDCIPDVWRCSFMCALCSPKERISLIGDCNQTQQQFHVPHAEASTYSACDERSKPFGSAELMSCLNGFSFSDAFKSMQAANRGTETMSLRTEASLKTTTEFRLLDASKHHQQKKSRSRLAEGCDHRHRSTSKTSSNESDRHRSRKRPHSQSPTALRPRKRGHRSHSRSRSPERYKLLCRRRDRSREKDHASSEVRHLVMQRVVQCNDDELPTLSDASVQRLDSTVVNFANCGVDTSTTNEAARQNLKRSDSHSHRLARRVSNGVLRYAIGSREKLTEARSILSPLAADAKESPLRATVPLRTSVRLVQLSDLQLPVVDVVDEHSDEWMMSRHLRSFKGQSSRYLAVYLRRNVHLFTRDTAMTVVINVVHQARRYLPADMINSVFIHVVELKGTRNFEAEFCYAGRQERSSGSSNHVAVRNVVLHWLQRSSVDYARETAEILVKSHQPSSPHCWRPPVHDVPLFQRDANGQLPVLFLVDSKNPLSINYPESFVFEDHVCQSVMQPFLASLYTVAKRPDLVMEVRKMNYATDVQSLASRWLGPLTELEIVRVSDWWRSDTPWQLLYALVLAAFCENVTRLRTLFETDEAYIAWAVEDRNMGIGYALDSAAARTPACWGLNGYGYALMLVRENMRRNCPIESLPEKLEPSMWTTLMHTVVVDWPPDVGQ